MSISVTVPNDKAALKLAAAFLTDMANLEAWEEIAGAQHSFESEAPATTADVERDADGLTWDARIHALASDGSHPKSKAGKWRKKKNVDQQFATSVEAELRAQAAPATPAPATPAPATPAPATQPIVTFADLMTAIVARSIPPEEITKTLVAFGVADLPALAQRPDLIPTVSTTLGLS